MADMAQFDLIKANICSDGKLCIEYLCYLALMIPSMIDILCDEQLLQYYYKA